MGCLSCMHTSRKALVPGKNIFGLVCSLTGEMLGAGCGQYAPQGSLPPDPRGLDYDEPARLMHEARYVCRLRLDQSHHGYLDGVGTKRGEAARRELETAAREQWKARAGWMRPHELQRARNV